MANQSIKTTEEAADILYIEFGSRELRDMASRFGVSRSRGDNAKQTATKIAEQRPGAAASALADVDGINPSPFAHKRQAYADEITLAEAQRRAPTSRMMYRMRRLKNIMPALPNHEAAVGWDYDGSGLVSISISPSNNAGHWATRDRAHGLLTLRGGINNLIVKRGSGGEANFTDRHGRTKKAWNLWTSAVEDLGPK